MDFPLADKLVEMFKPVFIWICSLQIVFLIDILLKGNKSSKRVSYVSWDLEYSAAAVSITKDKRNIYNINWNNLY